MGAGDIWDLRPGLSAQVKALFTKQHRYFWKKTPNVHSAGPFVSLGVPNSKREPAAIPLVATRVESLGRTLCTRLPSSEPLGRGTEGGGGRLSAARVSGRWILLSQHWREHQPLSL